MSPLISILIRKRMNINNIRCPNCNNKLIYPFNECNKCKWVPNTKQQKFQQYLVKRYEKKYRNYLYFLKSRVYYSDISLWDIKKYSLKKNIRFYLILLFFAMIIGLIIVIIDSFNNSYNVSETFFSILKVFTLIIFLLLSVFTIMLINDIRENAKEFEKSNYHVIIGEKFLFIKTNRYIINSIPINAIKSIEIYNGFHKLMQYHEGLLQIPIIEPNRLLVINLNKEITIINYQSRELKRRRIFIDINKRIRKSFINDLKQRNPLIKSTL